MTNPMRFMTQPGLADDGEPMVTFVPYASGQWMRYIDHAHDTDRLRDLLREGRTYLWVDWDRAEGQPIEYSAKDWDRRVKEALRDTGGS